MSGRTMEADSKTGLATELARGVTGCRAHANPVQTAGDPIGTHIAVGGYAAHNEVLDVSPRQARVGLQRERHHPGRDRGGGRGATERCVCAVHHVGRRQVLRGLQRSDMWQRGWQHWTACKCTRNGKAVSQNTA